jgi:hypothetical protein
MSLPAGSIIRSPSNTLIVLEDRSLRTLRDGNTTWKETALAPWASLDTFLAETKPIWWQVTFDYPKGWFDEAHRLHKERVEHVKVYGVEFYNEKHLTEEQRAYREARSDEKTFGVAHAKFRAEIVEPFVKAHGLTKASDTVTRYDYTYGTVGSPASKTAAQQLREAEPDSTKWTTFWHNLPDLKERKKYEELLYRYLLRSTVVRATE